MRATLWGLSIVTIGGLIITTFVITSNLWASPQVEEKREQVKATILGPSPLSGALLLATIKPSQTVYNELVSIYLWSFEGKRYLIFVGGRTKLGDSPALAVVEVKP